MVEMQDSVSYSMEALPDGNSDDEADRLPQIQRELDKLNHASTEINRLENELDEARSKYRSIITETSARMEALSHDRKKSIHRAREYYKLREEAKMAQGEALKAARQFQTATGVYKAAKETVALAECRLIEETDTPTAHLDSAWQEMLSHAISKVNEAEREKAKSEQEHKRKATRYAELEERIQMLEKKYTRSIKRSKAYFELKAELDIKLMQQKHNVHDLQTGIKVNKMKYSESFKTLEAISDAIHISRNNKIWSMFPRMPGVGSDTFSVSSGLSDLGLGSTTDATSKDSDADTESSGEEYDNARAEGHANFTTDDPLQRKGSGSSLSTSVINENTCSAKTSQEIKGDLRNKTEDMSETMNKNNSNIDQYRGNATTGIKDHETQNHNSVPADKMMVSIVHQGVKTNHEDKSADATTERVNSIEENSDDVFEEAYESCDEGEEVGQDKQEKDADTIDFAKAQKETVDQCKSNSEIDNIENAETKEQTDIKDCVQEKAETKQEQKHEVDKDTMKDDQISNNTIENSIEAGTSQSVNKTSANDYGPNQQDMRNIERPSLSGAED